MEMQWQDPPTASRKSKWKVVAEALKERPNKWAFLRSYEGSNAKRNAYSLAGRLRKTFGEAYEVTSRGTGEEEAGVWARYTGEAKAKPLSPDMSDEDLLDALGG